MSEILDRKIALFILVAETGSISAAAKKAFMTQPALSHIISQLEQELGIKLFERSSKGMQLTPAGEVLLSESLSIRKQVNSAIDRAKALALHPEKELLMLGVSKNYRELLFSEVISEFSISYPNVRILTSTYPANELPDCLSAGIVDLATFWESPMLRRAKCCWHKIKTFDVGIAMSSSHHLATKEIISLNDLLGEMVVTNSYGHFDCIDSIRNACEIYNEIIFIDADDDMPMENYLYEGTMALVPFPYPYVRPGIKVIRLDISQKIPVGFATAKNPKPLTLEFINTARKIYFKSNYE